MVATQWIFLGFYLTLMRIPPAASTITLSRFQPVSGFSQECTDTYNTPLSACTALDFANGQPCSKSCIDFLDNLTATIQKACQGTKVNRDTLMGKFFTFRGTKTICPNAQGSSGSDAANGVDVEPTTTVTSKFQPSGIPEPTQDSFTEPTTAISSLAVPVNPATSSSSLITSVTTLDSTAAITTSVPTIPLSVLTAASTTEAVKPEATDNSEKLKATNGDGGGTPFDVTSSSHHSLRPMTLGTFLLVWFATLTCLV